MHFLKILLRKYKYDAICLCFLISKKTRLNILCGMMIAIKSAETWCSEKRDLEIKQFITVTL
jgi:hypothetical protein